MTFQKSIGTKLTLLGLAAAFLYSALVLPVSSSDLQKAQDSHLTITQAGNHSNPNAPIPLPGEEKEEENRGEKDSKYIIAFIIPIIEFSQGLHIEQGKNRWQYSALTPVRTTPIYLLEHSFQI